jgi:hypothetical protein
MVRGGAAFLWPEQSSIELFPQVKPVLALSK